MTYEAFAAAADQRVTVWEVPTGREIASLHVGETVAILALVHGPDRQPAVALAAPAGKVTSSS